MLEHLPPVNFRFVSPKTQSSTYTESIVVALLSVSRSKVKCHKYKRSFFKLYKEQRKTQSARVVFQLVAISLMDYRPISDEVFAA